MEEVMLMEMYHKLMWWTATAHHTIPHDAMHAAAPKECTATATAAHPSASGLGLA